MPRRLRLDIPGAWYHVGNRGLNHRALFETEADARRFIALLAIICRAGLIELHAYCVMTNHFHLLVRSTDANLSKALQWIESVYVGKFNRGRGRDGPLFKGRFFSKLVRSETYRRAVVRYIDANPVDARIETSSGAYPYSRMRDYLRADGPPWLTRTWIEGAVRASAGIDSYDPAAYVGVFGGGWTPAALRWFDRYSASDDRDELAVDDVVSAQPEHVRRWLERCAIEADGSISRPPVVDAETVISVVAAGAGQRPDWQIRQRRRHRSGWDVVRVGLLRDLAGESFADVGRRVGSPSRTICGIYPEHRRQLDSCAEYRSIVETTTQRAIAECHGRVPRISPIGV